MLGGISTTRPYSLAVTMLLMSMLAMAAVVAALGLFAFPAGAQEVPDECPSGTVQVAESDADSQEHTTTFQANGQTVTLTYVVSSQGVDFNTSPSTPIDAIVFRGEFATIQYSAASTSICQRIYRL